MSEDSNKDRVIQKVFSWTAVTVVAIVVTWLALMPRSCLDVKACHSEWSSFHETGNYVSVYAVGGLATALVLEVASLYLTYQSALPIIGLVRGVEATFIPPAMLSGAFAALLALNAVFAYSQTPWYVHACATGIAGSPGRPVYTAIYAEWLINVPILLIVAGRCALFRPLKEVSRPLIVTNVYIVLAWAAHFIEQLWPRRVVVVLAFIMYGFASMDMISWVTVFRASTRQDLPSKTLRPLLTYGLIITFGVYGLVYVSSLEGLISSEFERMFFQISDLTTKFGLLMAFAGIRASQYHDLITMLLVNANTNFSRQAAVGEGEWDNNPPGKRTMDMDD